IHFVFQGMTTDSIKGKPLNSMFVESLKLRGISLSRLGRFTEAEHLYQSLAAIEPGSVKSLVALGRLYLQNDRNQEANKAFVEAYQSDPEYLPAKFYRTLMDTDDIESHQNQLVVSLKDKPLRMVNLGQLYGENRLYDSAIFCYRRAIEFDPRCFPAWLALADTLAYARHYKSSANVYKHLDTVYPDNRKVQISWARMLSWDRDYSAAGKLYEHV
ncbi:MAG: tetratricopeptide repeat protein, partial [Bacteroides sp.]|nr:tetratricopeptide repeat protein [Bacteroides sp.]